MQAEAKWTYLFAYLRDISPNGAMCCVPVVPGVHVTRSSDIRDARYCVP
jgi:hypothetical protein